MDRWHQQLRSKIVSWATLAEKVAAWREAQQRIVFTNGVFDLLHPGHIDYLGKAADLGDRLIIGLNSNASAQSLNKGPNRPIQDERARAIILSALAFVDAVALFEDPNPYELIKIVQPDYLVKGGDYTPDQVIGGDIVNAAGGQVAIIDFLPGFSTTSIERKIRGEE